MELGAGREGKGERRAGVGRETEGRGVLGVEVLVVEVEEAVLLLEVDEAARRGGQGVSDDEEEEEGERGDGPATWLGDDRVGVSLALCPACLKLEQGCRHWWRASVGRRRERSEEDELVLLHLTRARLVHSCTAQSTRTSHRHAPALPTSSHLDPSPPPPPRRPSPLSRSTMSNVKPAKRPKLRFDTTTGPQPNLNAKFRSASDFIKSAFPSLAPPLPLLARSHAPFSPSQCTGPTSGPRGTTSSLPPTARARTASPAPLTRPFLSSPPPLSSTRASS